jgi:hypothetical protein
VARHPAKSAGAGPAALSVVAPVDRIVVGPAALSVVALADRIAAIQVEPIVGWQVVPTRAVRPERTRRSANRGVGRAAAAEESVWMPRNGLIARHRDRLSGLPAGRCVVPPVEH